MALPAALTMQMQRSPLAALVQERGRLLRFALTGGLAALTQLLLLELLVGQGAPAIAANVSAFIVAAQVNFWLSSLFTWRDRAGAPGMAGLAGRWLRFHGAILGTAVLNLAVFSVSVTVLPHLMAAVLGIGAAAAANFVSGDRFVFRRARAISSMSTRRGAGRPGSVRTAGGQVLRASASPPAALDPSGQSVDAPLLEDRDADLPADALDLRDGGPMHTSPRAVPIWRRGRLWARLGMSGVMLLAAGLYCWGLARNGFGNEYYTAAALSGALSWKAFFYGALDPGSFITVDKPPFAIWVQSLSVRLFGLSSWSVLLPQALAALGTLAAVMVMTRRQFGAVSAILAGLALALTPITVAVARVNLPDNVLILLLVLGAWATLAAARTGRLRLLLLGMALVGIGFNTKMLQAFVVVPAFTGTYLLAAPGGLLRRLAHLTAAGVVLLSVSASWMMVVDSVPADARPYIGGSSDNSVLDLTLGYNGLGRIFGQGLTRSASPTEIVTRVAEAVKTAMQPADETTTAAADGDGARGFGPGGPGGPGFGGQPGALRLFNQQIGGQIGWLLPLAAAGLLAGLLATARRPRTDAARAWYLLWGGWLVTHAVVFSFAGGILHPYYTSALAPGVAALVGPGVMVLWQAYRRRWWLTWALPAALTGTAAVGVMLVSRSSQLPWLAPSIIAMTASGLVIVLIARLIRRPFGRKLAVAGLTVALVGVLAGPTAWAITPLRSAGMTANPQAGPSDSFGFGFGAGRGGPDGRGTQGGDGGPPAGPDGQGQAPGMPPLPLGIGAPPAGFQPPAGVMPPFQRGRGGDGNGPDGAGGMGGPGGPAGPGGRVSSEMLDYLQAHRGSAEYLVAVNSSMAASPIILETRLPVIAMGGFSGGDPAPTADQLARLVADGRLRFVLLGGRGGPGGGPGGHSVSGERQAWVQKSCAVVDPSAYGAADTSADGGSQASFRGRSGEQLYDCSSALP